MAQRVAATVEALGVQRFDLGYGAGTLPHADLMSTIGLYGTEALPRVRELVS